MEKQLPELLEDISKVSGNNIKFVNMIQENVRNQSDNMNYMEKKLEFIEKTMELKTKHFDETIKTYMESNSDLAKTVQANLHTQGNTL
ncbi:MAG: hypothetical protein HY787_21475, partial [Deltaproteobacteria bacterium]|nr:hypothetical protein [Deltaproteobacteria bacterium]